MYKYIFKKFLFLLPAETAHDLVQDIIYYFCLFWPTRILLQWMYRLKTSNSKLAGLLLQSMVGIPGGMSKDGRMTYFAHHMRYGFIEVGTVTPEPQEGIQNHGCSDYQRMRDS